MSYREAEDFDYNISADPEDAYSINRELNLAHRIIEETGANLFLTGKAGTGKTTFLRHLSETTNKRMVVLAPTGVAAINAGGMTLHSFFQLPFSPFIPGRGFLGEEKHFYRMSKEKRRIIASLDLIVIDEISMVRPDLLDGIDDLLRRLRGSNDPFGGVQLLLIGDIRQLSPVLKENERLLLKDIYPSPYFFDSIALRRSGFITVELRTIYRQQDPAFINLLNAVRDGLAGREELQALNRLCAANGDSGSDSIIRLTTHNQIADRTNAMRLALLPGDTVKYTAGISGKFPESSYPADFNLILKEGARVMFIKNDTGIERRYYNGLLGTVRRLSDESVIVEPDDSPGSFIEVGYAEWENVGYSIDEKNKKVMQSVEGVFSQIPLRLAWSITIHKSQGLTFDKAIIDASNSFAPGLLYVALSRCRSLAGLKLETPLTQDAVIIDNNVNKFIEDSRRNAPDATMLSKLQAEYCRMLLAELFNFSSLGIAFRDFSRSVIEYVAPVYPELFNCYREAEKIFLEKIENVGLRFITLYASKPIDPYSLSTNKVMLEKISGGCRYFLEQLDPVCAILNDTPCEINNAAYSRRLTNTADILSFEMKVKKHILTALLSEPFTPARYIEIKSEAILTVTNRSTNAANATSRSAKKKSPKIPKLKKPKGYSIYETLTLFRETGSIDETALRRNLAESTIARHLVELINNGDLTIAEALPATILSSLTATAAQYHPSDSPSPIEESPRSNSPYRPEESLFSYLKRHHPSLSRHQISLFTRTRR